MGFTLIGFAYFSVSHNGGKYDGIAALPNGSFNDKRTAGVQDVFSKPREALCNSHGSLRGVRAFREIRDVFTYARPAYLDNSSRKVKTPFRRIIFAA